MKPFLYLDNWHARQKETRFDRYLHASGLAIEVKCTNEGEFPAGTDYCGVFISPSFNGAYEDLPWIHRAHEVLQRLGEARVPMIGLCFGSQILASALVARDQVFIRPEREKGFGSIHLTNAAKSDAIAADLPSVMPVFHWHGDEVMAGHDDVIVLADSDGCGNQLWRWTRGPVWGVQPHPEIDRVGLIEWFQNNREEFEAGGLKHDELVAGAHDSSEAFGILKNFVDLVRGPGK